MTPIQLEDMDGREPQGVVRRHTASATDAFLETLDAPEPCDTGTPDSPCTGCPDCKAGAAVDLFQEDPY